MAEETVVLSEHVLLFFFCTPASRLVLFPPIDIDYSSQVLQNDKSVLSVRCPPNQCGLPHPSAHSMEMSPLEKIYITSVDV